MLAKVIAERLKRVLPTIVNEDQFGFIHGRRINDPIRIFQLLIEYAKQTTDDDDLALLFADQEKAFD